jgi:predicted nucleic acid-binding protein
MEMSRILIDTNIYSNAPRKNGMPPTNDIWIAATAFKNGLKLYIKAPHFSKISGINLL